MQSKLSMASNLMEDNSMYSFKENSKVVHQLLTDHREKENHMLNRNLNIMTTIDITMTDKIIDGMIEKETRMCITEREETKTAIQSQT